MKLNELFDEDIYNYFVKIAQKISEKGYEEKHSIVNHSATGTAYLCMYAFTGKDGIEKYLNLICLGNNATFIVRKYYEQRDWQYLSDDEKIAWKGKNMIMPIDGNMYALNDISSIDIDELEKHISINSNFKKINSAVKTANNVFTLISNYFDVKEQKNALEERIRKMQEELQQLQKENIVSKIIKPLAIQCQELLGYDSYKLSKSNCPQGLRINITLEAETKEAKKLFLLFIDDYPVEIIGIDDNKVLKTQELPVSFDELAKHFR